VFANCVGYCKDSKVPKTGLLISPKIMKSPSGFVTKYAMLKMIVFVVPDKLAEGDLS
jgi:hypothetical protein